MQFGAESEFSGMEIRTDPRFLGFACDVFHDFASTAKQEDSERHAGFKPKCLSYPSLDETGSEQISVGDPLHKP